MVQTLIKSNKPRQLAKADVVFCIDISGSMEPCIDGVKNNIRQFIDSIETDPEVSIDWRLGILAHTSTYAGLSFYRLNLTNSIQIFQTALDRLETQIDEANLQALDWSLDSDWRLDAHKFVMMFTDEGVDGGWNPELSRGKINDLKQKIMALGVSLCIISPDGPEFDDYKDICTVNKGRFIGLPSKTEFSAIGFDELLEKLGKSVSQGSKGDAGVQQSVLQDIFGIGDQTQIMQI